MQNKHYDTFSFLQNSKNKHYDTKKYQTNQNTNGRVEEKVRKYMRDEETSEGNIPKILPDYFKLLKITNQIKIPMVEWKKRRENT